MASRSGSLLEKNVAKILELSGFKPQLNQVVHGYEIDVLLKFSGKQVAFECKQYERSTLGVRNLIHQWDSKNKELGFDRIVLALVGCDISEKEKQLAKKYGVLIWDEAKINKLLDAAIEKKELNKAELSKEFGLTATQQEPIEEKSIVAPLDIIITNLFPWERGKKTGEPELHIHFDAGFISESGFGYNDFPTQEALIKHLAKFAENEEDATHTLVIPKVILTADFFNKLKAVGVKCIVCKDIAKKLVKRQGWLAGYESVPEIDRNNVGVVIYTVDDLKKVVVERRKKFYEGTPL